MSGVATSYHKICRGEGRCFACRDGRWWRVVDCDKKVPFIDGGEVIDAFLPSEGGTNLEPLGDAEEQEIRQRCGPCERETPPPAQGGGGKVSSWFDKITGGIAQAIRAVAVPLGAALSGLSIVLGGVVLGLRTVLEPFNLIFAGVDFIDVVLMAVSLICGVLALGGSILALIGFIAGLLAILKDRWGEVLDWYQRHPAWGAIIGGIFVLLALGMVIVIILTGPPLFPVIVAGILIFILFILAISIFAR